MASVGGTAAGIGVGVGDTGAAVEGPAADPAAMKAAQGQTEERDPRKRLNDDDDDDDYEEDGDDDNDD